MTEFNFDIKNIDDAIEYVLDIVGHDLTDALLVSKMVEEDPSSIAGPKASNAALKLAFVRLRIGIAAQYWKQKAPHSKRGHDRLMKDALMVIYDALLETINVLKLRARIEDEIIDRNK